MGSDSERISVCESTGEHYRHYDCYQTTAIVIRREQLPLVRWQESVELCRVLTEETADHRDVDSRRPLTENVISSLNLESRFYAVLSKAA